MQTIVCTDWVLSPGFTQAHGSHQKCAMKIKEKKKNNEVLKNNFNESRTLWGAIREKTGSISVNFGLLILYIMKVLIL